MIIKMCSNLKIGLILNKMELDNQIIISKSWKTMNQDYLKEI